MTQDLLSIFEILFKGVLPFRLKNEDELSNQVATALKGYTLDGRLHCIWFHVPNEMVTKSNIDIFRQKKRKAMGMIPGVADFIFCSTNKTLCIELKIKKGRQSEHQKLFQQWVEHYNITYKICRSLREVETVLRETGLLE